MCEGRIREADSWSGAFSVTTQRGKRDADMSNNT